MRFAASSAAASDVEDVLEQLLPPMESRVTAGMVDLVMLFGTQHYADDLDDVIDRLYAKFPNAVLIGCTAEGTIGGNQEWERVASMSLLAASLPDVHIRPFYLTQKHLESAITLADWERMVAVAPESHPTFVAFGDPFRADLHGFVEQINEAYPGAPLMGGVASGARAPGENRLLIGHRIYHDGIVGVALTGQVLVDTVVSQGCRPIGTPFVITKGERNLIHELGGHAAIERLHQVLVGLSEEEERLAQQSLLVGRVIDEYKDRFERGDFLISNIIGVERTTGAVGISGYARVGSTVQFHVRDADSADEDLRTMLAPHTSADVRGAMLFGCNGRGTRMWSTPGHDVNTVHDVLGDVPVAGFFCGGEFGPIGGRNFIHAFTASIALFRQPQNSEAQRPEGTPGDSGPGGAKSAPA